jgi:flagellar biogenesis protein FliO
MMYGYGNGWIGMIVGLIITLLIIGGLIIFAVWAVRRQLNHEDQVNRLVK